MGYDAVVAWEKTGRFYFFKGARYRGWDIATRSDPGGYPRAITDGWGAAMFPADLDAVLWGNGGKAYFFRRDQYVRYLIEQDVPEAGFPRTYAPSWSGLFPSDLDAAVNVGGGKAYMFRGDEYMRYDMSADRKDPDYPIAIAGAWHGLWESGLDAATLVPGTRTVYFFRGSECALYDLDADRVLDGYPKPIATEFPGIPDPDPVSPYLLPAPAPTDGNTVTALTEGDAYFADLAAAIGAASGATATVELAAWDLQLGFELVPGDPTSTLAALLTAASGRSVAVRALLNAHQANPLGAGTVTGFDNTSQVAFVNALPTGAAIHDGRYLDAGTHHQKMAIVSSADGLVAYSGGMDPNPNRMTSAPGGGLHDVQVKVTGPAALAHHALFARRWTDHPDSAALPALVTPPAPRASGSQQVQVVATAGNGTAHAGIGPGGYSFAPTGDRTVRALVMRAIGAAQSFVYLEDQYLVDAATSAALVAALPHLSRVVVLIADTNVVNNELKQGWQRRREFVDPLVAAGGAKVSVLRGNQFIHSKTWIFDDAFAIVGSANVNRRGYTHDSEQAVGVVDRSDDPTWVRDLRVRLWSKHLGVPPAAVTDPLVSSALWSALPPTARVAPYVVAGGTDSPGLLLGGQLAWDNVLDPDGS